MSADCFWGRRYLISPSGGCATAHGGLCVLLLFLFLTIFVRSTISIVYQTDLRQIFTIGGTMSAVDQSEISFSIPQRMFPRQLIFVGFIHRTEFW